MKIDVSLDLYRIFCIVVSSGNMSAAARKLYISQPAVSMAIRQLENHMGSPLLIRTPKGVNPTAEGKLLYENLQQALGLIQSAQDKYFQMVNMQMGELKIGGSDTIIAHYLMPYLEKYHTLYQDIAIKVTNKTTYESLKLLKNGEVDVCFVNLPIEDEEDFDITLCKEIQDIFVGGKNFKSLQKDGLELKELNNYPLLLLEELSNSRRYINKYAMDNGVEMKPILELGSNDLLLDFAKINYGITCVTKEFTKGLENSETLFEIPIKPSIPKRHIGMVRLRNTIEPHSLKGLIDLIGNENELNNGGKKKV